MLRHFVKQPKASPATNHPKNHKLTGCSNLKLMLF